MFSHFFIDRPIFATVVSLVIVLTGTIALCWLPIAQYPQIAPPAVQVSIFYPGASAQVMADTVAAPIEQQVNGVENMLYMSSQMGNDGSYTLTVTFDLGTDLDTALVMVQNRVMLAMPILPLEVQSQGVTIKKKMPDILLIVDFFSPDGRYDDLYLSNYATIHVKDELLRVDGVSDLMLFGQRDFSIRAWLDPQKMASLGINANDVTTAIRRQNLDLPAGRIGQPPIHEGQTFDLPVDTLGRLDTPDQFGDIILKAGYGPPMATSNPKGPRPMAGGLPIPGISNPSPSTLSLASLLHLSTPTGAKKPTTPPSAVRGGVSTSGGASTGGGANATPVGMILNNTAAGSIEGLSINDQEALVSPGNIFTATALTGLPPTSSVAVVRLRDVARVEMGAQNYGEASTYDGHPAVGMAVFQLPGTNALDVAERVRAKMRELQSRFPEGIEYEIGYDTTPFIRESVNDVFRTLWEAALLVGVVVMLFLQSWRSVLIPMIAVPVAIIGTFTVMAAVGFSLNNISLFGLVLAIGIVVDDAIVVVENVERWLDQGLSPHEATYKAMDEVTGPVVAVAVVLCAVFIPCAMITGITGSFFRQFAVTIAASTLFSAVNSLTLSPALAAILLRPRHNARRDPITWLLDVSLGWFFRLFNTTFQQCTNGYAWLVGRLLRINLLVLIGYGGLLILTYTTFRAAPQGFVPEQDQGRIIANVQLPDAASLQRTREVLARVSSIAQKTNGVAHVITVAGYSFLQSANGSNFGSVFLVLDPFEKRRSPKLTADAIMAQLRKKWNAEIHDAQVLAFGAPPIPGLSVAGGFKLMVEDRSGLGLDILDTQTERLIDRLKNQPDLLGVSSQFRSNTPQLYLDVDRTKVRSVGVTIGDFNDTLQVYLGSLYVNNFNAFGRHWQVNIQADGKYRNHTDAFQLLKVRNDLHEMVPVGALATPREIGGPVFINRYNLYTAAAINGGIRPGSSSGEAIHTINRLADETLPLCMNKEWTELMFMQIRAGNTAMYVFALAVICVFLALAALYESWSLPMAVILVVPLCLLCSVVGVLNNHMAVNIFVQIGLVVLVGLACKNSILIVEFAKRLREEGRPRWEAACEASRLRLRPILMTSLAFILGVVPLVIAHGAGAEMRCSLGTAVFSGMVGVTLFGVFLTPVFFYVINGLGETRLFKARATQWLGAVLLCMGLGLGIGLILAKLGWLGLDWALTFGAAAGIVAGLGLQTFHRRTAARRQGTPS
ncbi:MAG: efflux RND transporter permease subunit [Thermoguttaceae bacterium]